MTSNRFRLDRDNGKFMGVCAGLADHFGVDVTLVRVGAVIAVATTFPFGLIAYPILAMVADGGSRPCQDAPIPPVTARGDAASDVRQRLRDLDTRMQTIETQIVDSRNSALAREIDALR